jgi:hypothetical protein
MRVSQVLIKTALHLGWEKRSGKCLSSRCVALGSTLITQKKKKKRLLTYTVVPGLAQWRTATILH